MTPEVRSVVVRSRQVVAGPIPPPEVLRDYEAAVPGLAERIVAMAEEEQRERIEAERHERESRVRAVRRGQFCALGAVALLAGGAVACAAFGAASVGVALAGATLLGVVASFVQSRKG